MRSPGRPKILRISAGGVAGAAEPVRHFGVKGGRIAGSEHQVLILKDESHVPGQRRGFTIHPAAQAFPVIVSFIYGFTQQQQNLTYTTPEQATAVAENILHRLPADNYPHLAAMIIEHALQRTTTTPPNSTLA